MNVTLIFTAYFRPRQETRRVVPYLNRKSVTGSRQHTEPLFEACIASYCSVNVSDSMGEIESSCQLLLSILEIVKGRVRFNLQESIKNINTMSNSRVTALKYVLERPGDECRSFLSSKEAEEFSDLDILCKEKRFQVHKTIVAGNSTTLRRKIRELKSDYSLQFKNSRSRNIRIHPLLHVLSRDYDHC